MCVHPGFAILVLGGNPARFEAEGLEAVPDLPVEVRELELRDGVVGVLAHGSKVDDPHEGGVGQPWPQAWR